MKSYSDLNSFFIQKVIRYLLLNFSLMSFEDCFPIYILHLVIFWMTICQKFILYITLLFIYFSIKRFTIRLFYVYGVCLFRRKIHMSLSYLLKIPFIGDPRKRPTSPSDKLLPSLVCTLIFIEDCYYCFYREPLLYNFQTWNIKCLPFNK